eukprot:scaffold59015_cov31-Tisochrysis_lutea.AAC.9
MQWTRLRRVPQCLCLPVPGASSQSTAALALPLAPSDFLLYSPPPFSVSLIHLSYRSFAFTAPPYP